MDEMLADDVETADALAEFDFVMGEDSGSESDVTVIELNNENRDTIEDEINIHMPGDSKQELRPGESRPF